MLDPVVDEGNIPAGVIHTIHFDPLHSSTDTIRVLHNDVIRRP